MSIPINPKSIQTSFKRSWELSNTGVSKSMVMNILELGSRFEKKPEDIFDLSQNANEKMDDKQISSLEDTLLEKPSGNESEAPKGTSSSQTVFGIVNSIVGSAILILPNLAMEAGILNIVVISLVVGLVSYHTCNIFVIHFRKDEHDLPEIILRILGKRWLILLGIFSGIEIFFTCIIYFVLICNMLYPMVLFGMQLFDFHNYAEKTEFTFERFSFQWATIIAIVPIGMMCFIKDLTVILKFLVFGFIPIIAYSIFIVYVLIENIVQGNVGDFSDFKLFSSNVSDVAGTFGLAFILHTSVCPLMKAAKNKANNTRDLRIGYFLSGLIYVGIAFVGYVGIKGRKVKNANNIMDYFSPSSIFPFIVELIYIVKLGTVFPLLVYVSREQFLSIF